MASSIEKLDLIAKLARAAVRDANTLTYLSAEAGVKPESVRRAADQLIAVRTLHIESVFDSVMSESERPRSDHLASHARLFSVAPCNCDDDDLQDI